MTHDELLAKIDSLLPVFDAKAPDYISAFQQMKLSLRAVVELHKPEHSIRGYRCSFDDELFPCKHHQAIEKELA